MTIYSSLFGIPVSGLPIGNISFSLESTYLELDCQNITSNITRDGAEFFNPGLISSSGPFKSAQNITNSTPWAVGYLGTDVTGLLPSQPFGSRKCPDCLPNNVRGTTFFPGLLLYQDFEGAQNVTSIYCAPSQAYVESTITCNKTETSQKCTVTAQRLSTLPHMPTQLTYLSFGQIFTGLSALLPETTQQLNHVDLLQNYITNPDDNQFIQSAQWPSASPNSTENGESRFLTLPLEDFGSRLGQVINAFLFGSTLNSPEILTHSTPLPNLTPATQDDDLVALIQNLTSTFTVPANITSHAQVYVASYPWLITYLISSLTLPFSALAAAILSRLSKAPDYLGFVSSIARESQYAGVPRGGVGMDGIQRTRGLRSIRIRLGDVGDAERGVEIGTGVALSVGVLAIGEEGSTKRIDGRKLYI
ncbi:hypothetical protein D0Z07_4744 [Hyphodiscus hymeniophilus]|uniref:Uncharacterized protein n=1 Tax=Hyphodiscus hymeniophilus TaxID=353542 RepID=A0A9P7AXI1_9HELO|nr:hypothetical protein D0Z07_4744 [Hyphodiscus hymeniophilus]